MKKISRQEALDYHEEGRPGKIEVVATKPTATQRDLSMAYTPGVAQPCKEIEADPLAAYRYTAKGNLVAVVSNGTAVLGLGSIGAQASKPVMEGKGVLFKRFADIDVFDIELDVEDVDEMVRTVRAMEPTFGGINLEDIKAPECFEIEQRLRKEMGIPVFHDDQHGTAIIAGAALLNGLEIVEKDIGEVKIVFSGSGAAAMGCLWLWMQLGVKKENIILCDSKGVVYQGRTEGMNAQKEEFAADTSARSLADAMEGADVFVGLSVAGVVSQDMLRAMADRPLVFALANPDPEIAYEDAMAARDDVVMATGRSDYPNQVNNVLGFPFIFRGALDVRATDINEEMKLAAVRALAELAREDVPDSVLKAYGLDTLRFGPEYLIPKPFDHRVLLEVPIAVARAAIETGVARSPIDDFGAYRRRLSAIVSRRLDLMHDVMQRAARDPKRVVFPEGESFKIIRAAKIITEEGLAHPILLGRPEVIGPRMEEIDLDADRVTIIHPASSDKLEEYTSHLYAARRRDGVTRRTAAELIVERNYFGSMMVKRGDADGLISGLTTYYSETIRPALHVIGVRPDVARVAGAYMLILEDRLFFLADTTVNIEPDAETLAEIAILTARFARRFVEPRVAMLSFSNFGSNSHVSARRMRRATQLVKEWEPGLIVDGEMQADTAVLQGMLADNFPFSELDQPANVLIFPELNSANIAYKLIWRLANAEAIGPILIGMDRPVHVLQRGVDVADIVNMAAICVVDAQEAEKARRDGNEDESRVRPVDAS